MALKVTKKKRPPHRKQAKKSKKKASPSKTAKRSKNPTPHFPSLPSQPRGVSDGISPSFASGVKGTPGTPVCSAGKQRAFTRTANRVARRLGIKRGRK